MPTGTGEDSAADFLIRLGRALHEAGFSAAAVAQATPPLSVYIATVAGLILLLPGYTLTVALSELTAALTVERRDRSGTRR